MQLSRRSMKQWQSTTSYNINNSYDITDAGLSLLKLKLKERVKKLQKSQLYFYCLEKEQTTKFCHLDKTIASQSFSNLFFFFVWIYQNHFFGSLVTLIQDSTICQIQFLVSISLGQYIMFSSGFCFQNSNIASVEV